MNYSCDYCEGGVPRKAVASKKIKLKASGPLERWRVGSGCPGAVDHGWSPWNRTSAALSQMGPDFYGRPFLLANWHRSTWTVFVETHRGEEEILLIASELPQLSDIEIVEGPNV